MGLKEFFRPNKWKILLFVLLGVVSLYYLRYFFGIPEKTGFAYLPILGKIFLLGVGLADLVSGPFFSLFIILSIILQIIYFYIISSLIVFIFQKTRKQ
jgi:hypothetical protein